jgi:PHD/YefM family antitoxin component YafN of YafNO toxin-antitoxin module
MGKEEINQVLEGRKLISHENHDVKEVVEISTEDYKHIKEVVNEEIEMSNVRNAKQVLARTIGDCCRIFAVLSRHDEKLYRTILRLKASYV